MSPAIRRFVEREGQSATLREFSPTGTDDYNDPTDQSATTTSTTAVVEELRNPRTITTPSGEEVTVERRMIVPDTLSVDPEASELRPQIEVGGHSYKIWAVDPDGVMDGVQALLVQRLR